MGVAMKTVLVPCRVPWMISQSMSGVTLTHCETSVEPECFVVLGGGGIRPDGVRDNRRIEVTFKLCYYARVGHHYDTGSVESLGYEFVGGFDTEWRDFSRFRDEWLRRGDCPDSGFYVAQESAWLSELPSDFREGYRHYVIDGRDGYVELVAQSFAWREWMWGRGERDDAANNGPVVRRGEGVA